ncbi:MAG: aspartate kinase, monofunctional class [Candidatus Promineifilaceae bacterium]|nr:aspartate kinase, monofunctional class [Candidatus Promineifilaceae bacterium]
MTLVMKFGGTSVGSVEAIQRTADLIQNTLDERGEIVVVVSAMGSRPTKVTDLLLQGAHSAAGGDPDTYRRMAASLHEIHVEAANGLLAPPAAQRLRSEIDGFVERFVELCRAVHVLGELTPRALDAISAMGEQMSVRLLDAYLNEEGIEAQAIDATNLIITDNHFQSATPLLAETEEHVNRLLQPLLEDGTVPVVTGFIGATRDGVTTTLGRGGSDYSAALLGQALQADEVWIWTDVDGVMTADPRLVAAARTVPALTYREVAELAYYGARVLHPKTIRPCVESAIPLRIKNTFNPKHPGTVIVPDNGEGDGGMKAVTAIESLSLLTVEGKGMMGVPGIAARTFSAVAREGVNVLLISQASSEQSICFSVPAGDTDAVTSGLEAEFAEELRRRDIDRVWALQPVSIVTVVGAGMRGTPGIAGRIFSALGREGINIIAIAQGSSECSISLVVDAADTAGAVQHIHTLL